MKEATQAILLLCLISLTITVTTAAKIEKETKHKKYMIPTLKGHKKTESIFKKLEYDSLNSASSAVDDVVPVDLNLLSDDRLALDVEDSINQEFLLIDKELGDAPDPDPPADKTSRFRNNRQMSLMYQGVYAPDSRFNAFVDGVMVNMVVEMKRKKMDPLYFRVYDRGVIEHVPTRTNRQGRSAQPPQLTSTDVTSTSRTARQRSRGTAIGGGVVRGLTKVKRFGNAEVQVAGNTTLVRSHYIFGPLNVELVFETPKGVKTINSTLSALAGHALAEIMPDNNSSRHKEFFIDSPLDYQIELVGAQDRRYRSLSKSAVLRLYKPEGRMERRLAQCFKKAYDKPIVNVAKNTKRKGRSKNRKNSQKREKRQRKINNRNRNGEQRGVALNMDTIGSTPDRLVRDDSIGSNLGIAG